MDIPLVAFKQIMEYCTLHDLGTIRSLNIYCYNSVNMLLRSYLVFQGFSLENPKFPEVYDEIYSLISSNRWNKLSGKKLRNNKWIHMLCTGCKDWRDRQVLINSAPKHIHTCSYYHTISIYLKLMTRLRLAIQLFEHLSDDIVSLITENLIGGERGVLTRIECKFITLVFIKRKISPVIWYDNMHFHIFFFLFDENYIQDSLCFLLALFEKDNDVDKVTFCNDIHAMELIAVSPNFNRDNVTYFNKCLRYMTHSKYLPRITRAISRRTS